MSQYLGIDIGTTRTKVVSYDDGLRRVVAVRAALTPVYVGAGGECRNALKLLALVDDLLARLLTDPAVTGSVIAGVSVGSIGEEVVLLDSHGHVTAPVLAWHASHGAVAKAALPTAGTALAGLDDTFSVFKLAWLNTHLPDAVRAAKTFTSVADFIAASLAETTITATFLNVSHASRTGLLNLTAGELQPAVLTDLGLPTLVVPTLVASGTVVGHTGGRGPLPAGIAVVTGGHDHFCGAFGSGARSPGSVYISAGTSEAQVLLTSTIPDHVTASVDVGLFVAGNLRYLHRATPSGRLYQIWRDMLFADADEDILWSEVESAVDVPPATLGSNGHGVQFPELSLSTRRGHLMASLLKGLAQEAERTTHELATLAAVDVTDVIVAGLPAASPSWRRLRQNATSRRLRFVGEVEATALGVALLAQRAVTGHADLPVDAITTQGERA